MIASKQLIPVRGEDRKCLLHTSRADEYHFLGVLSTISLANIWNIEQLSTYYPRAKPTLHTLKYKAFSSHYHLYGSQLTIARAILNNSLWRTTHLKHIHYRIGETGLKWNDANRAPKIPLKLNRISEWAWGNLQLNFPPLTSPSNCPRLICSSGQG